MEDILFKHNYIFTYFDGLNKYYIAKEKDYLLNAFKSPPNVFDEFILANHRDAILKMDQAEEKASEAEAKASEAEAKASEAEIRANDALHHYHMVINSKSWKLMKPFRLAGKFSRWFVVGAKHWITFSPTSRPRRVLKQVVISLKNYINVRPKLKNKIINILNRFPKIKARLKKIGQQKDIISSNNYQAPEYLHLTPRAQEIYNKLKLAIDENKKSVK